MFKNLQIAQAPLGLFFGALAYFIFVLSDVSNKKLSLELGYNVFQIMLLVAVAGCIGLWIGCVLLKKLSLLKANNYRHSCVCGITSTMSIFCGIMGFMKLPLTTAYAILFTGPLLMALMACFLLKEQIAFHRWFAVTAGFLGGMLVTLPGWSLLNPLSLFDGSEAGLTPDYLQGLGYMLVSVAALSTSNIYTRRFGYLEQPLSLFFYSILLVQLPLLLILFACAAFSPAVAEIAVFSMPAIEDLDWFFYAAVTGNLGAVFIIAAFRLPPASALSSLLYSQIVWGAILGGIFFEETHDASEYTGIAIIVLSACYLFWREAASEKISTYTIVQAAAK